MRRVGLEISDISSSTRSEFQYFSPTHSRRDAMLCLVTASIGALGSVDVGWESRLCAGGGVGPPRTTVEMKPEFCSASISFRWNFVSGTDVSPNRALLAFCRCEATLARWTRDMMD